MVCDNNITRFLQFLVMSWWSFDLILIAQIDNTYWRKFYTEMAYSSAVFYVIWKI